MQRGVTAGAGVAVSGEAEDKAIKARQSVMQLLSFNLGKLGAMVKGDMAYDADQAMIAANNLKAVASIRQDAMTLRLLRFSNRAGRIANAG